MKAFGICHLGIQSSSVYEITWNKSGQLYSETSFSVKQKKLDKIMKKISSSRAVYEVNLHGASGTVPGPICADNMRVRQREQTSSIPGKSLNPRKESETKFKFTKFPVRKQEAIIDKDEGTSSGSVE